MIEIKNLRHQSGGYPHYLADFILHTPKGDIVQNECDIQQTAGNLLSTLLQDHDGKNGANENALLVGECGVAECCGEDFSVHTEGDIVRLSWADPQELSDVVLRESRAHTHRAIFPNDYEVKKVEVEVPQREYAEAVLRFAAMYMKSAAKRGERDQETQKLFERCRARYPEIFSKVSSKVERSDIIEFDEEGC